LHGRAATWYVVRQETGQRAGNVVVRIEHGWGFRGLEVSTSLPAPSPEELRFAGSMVEGMSEQQQSQVRAALARGASTTWCFASGWPLLAVSCDIDDVRGRRGGWRINPGLKVGTARGVPRAIAWRPMWPGFVINSAAFAAMWWMILLAATGLTQASRRRRGRCTRCGYDLRGSIEARCPECGTTSNR
jgi:hypothetical protein